METHCPHLYCLPHHLVLHHLGRSQILGPQFSAMEPPLPKHTGSRCSLYYSPMEYQSPALELFNQCSCAQRHKPLFRPQFSAISKRVRPAAPRPATICQNAFWQIFCPLLKGLIARVLALLEQDPIMLCTGPVLTFQNAVTPCTDPRPSLGQTMVFTCQLCDRLF
jgi:hypothetical protein